MKTITLICTALVGFAGSASAMFTIDFSAFSVGTALDPDLVVNVPGYGDVRFTETIRNNDNNNSVSQIEVTAQHAGGAEAESLNFNNNEQLIVTFEGAERAIDISFTFVGVGDNESFSINSVLNLSGDSERQISFRGNSAGLGSVTFNAVPEPSSTLLIGLAGLSLAARRRR